LAYSHLLLQPVGPKGGSPSPGPATTSYPSTSDSGASGGTQSSPQSTLFLLAPMLLVVVFMLFSNRSQRKREAEVRGKLKKGDKVVSQSGLIGELIDFDDRVAKVKIAPGTNVQMLTSTISPFEAQASTSSATSTDKKLSDLKDAKAAAEKKG